MPQPPDLPRSSTPDRVLNAVMALLSEQRLRDVTIESVAEAAGVSRQTVYRHFGSRDGLFRAAVIREETRLAMTAREAVQGVQDIEEAVAIATSALLTSVRRHPLIDRLLADDPETLLPYIALGGGPVLGTAGTIVRELLERFLPGQPDLAREVADVLSRLVISHTLAPGDRSPDEVGQLAARMVRGGLLAPPLS